MSISAPANTHGRLRFLTGADTPAVYHASEAGGAVPAHEGDFVDHDVPIIDARPLTGECDLDHEGFTLETQNGSAGDFYDDAWIQKAYEPQLIELVRQRTGATTVLIFDHTRRSSSASVRESRRVREPASIVHADYSHGSGIKTREEVLNSHPQRQIDRTFSRFAIFNTWRSICGTVLRSPLTFCAADSVQSRDLVAVKRLAKNHTGELQLAVYSDSQRWYYFPQMGMDELLLFKTYDSSLDGRARFNIHSAFDDPQTPADAPPRESIESRCLALFD